MKLHPDKAIDKLVRQLNRKLSREERNALFQKIEEESLKQHLVYEKENGELRRINVMSTPRLLTLRQRRYLTKVAHTMNRAFFKVGRLYLRHPKVQRLFPFTASEKRWIDPYLPLALANKDELVSRWDAVCDFSQRKMASLHFFVENNAVGIGGIYYIPTTEKVILNAVAPALHRLAPGLRFRKNPDLLGLLLRALQRQARRLKLKRPQVALVVDCFSRGGPVEFPHLAEYLQAHGLSARVCDARQLRLRKNGKIYFRNYRVDLIYRDTELSELIEYEELEKRNMDPMRRAFAENRVVSSILGELDHKSLLELFTSPEYARHFTAAERKIFRRHTVWTRLLAERQTTNPRGNSVDLPRYVRAHKNGLVIKPNRLFGGEGVTLGKNVPQREWEKAVDAALRRPGEWVAQSLAPIVSKPYLVREKGKYRVDNFNFVLGLAPVAGGLGILGRASRKEVVNVARLGGLAAVLLTS